MSIRKLMVLRVFVSDYHSGQWSRGYRLSCAIDRKLKRIKGNSFITDEQIRIARKFPFYKELETKYANKM